MIEKQAKNPTLPLLYQEIDRYFFSIILVKNSIIKAKIATEKFLQRKIVEKSVR